MLISTVNSFTWSVDNFGTGMFTSSSFGTQFTTGAANTKGSAVELLGSASVASDVYAVYLAIVGTPANANRRSFLVDILVDTAGGTSYAVKIPNLLSQSNVGGHGCGYYFPIFIPAGSSIAAQAQCNAATITGRVAIRVFGKPINPELVRVGSVVEAIGVATANTGGVSVTPGNDAWGSWTSLGTSGQDNWWWQSGLIITDTTMTTQACAYHLSGGDATNKKILVPEIVGHTYSSDETLFHPAFGAGLPICMLPSGNTIYGRAYSQGTADTGYQMTAYGMK